jgi:hypothetical protein
MKKLVFLIFVAVFGVVFFRCDGLGSQNGGLLSSSGRAGEVLVVCSEKQWKGVLGDSLHSVLMQPVWGLPQIEPMFLLSQVSENYFKDAYKKQRNIILFSIDASLEQERITVNHDVWATPQLLIQVKAKNEQQAAEALSKYEKTIIKYLLNADMKRFQRAQRSNQYFHISNEVGRLFNISIVIPEGFSFAKKDSNFVWLRKDTKEWTQNLMVYTENYTDTNQLKNKHIIRLRDFHTQRNVFGGIDSSYIAVEDKHIPTLSEYVEFKEGYTIRTVGLWEMVNDFMGGPFVNMTILDKKNNRIVTLDGFLYAPSDHKRDFLRQLEAILLSVKFKQ